MEKICGIYCIENIVNSKKYIGQAVDIYRRWKDHKNKLNSNKHCNIYLQRAWDKYGEENFSFYIIEECHEDMLNKNEKFYISKFDCMNPECGYNLESGGNSGKTISIKTRIKMSEAMIGKHVGGNNPNAHSVYCPQLDRIFDCIMDVEREGIACEAGVRDCLYGRSKSAGKHPITGEKLTWYDVENMNDPVVNAKINDEKNGISHIKLDPRIKPIYCIELNKIFIGGSTQADKEGIVNRTCIVQHLSGKKKSAGKHPITGEPLHWKTLENYNT